MEFIKHFCRLVTEHELSNAEIAEYFDIVQSINPTKIVQAHSADGETVSADVMIYTSNNDYIYEIVLDDQIDMDEGENIADLLDEEFEFDFEFETSMEV